MQSVATKFDEDKIPDTCICPESGTRKRPTTKAHVSHIVEELFRLRATVQLMRHTEETRDQSGLDMSEAAGLGVRGSGRTHRWGLIREAEDVQSEMYGCRADASQVSMQATKASSIVEMLGWAGADTVKLAHYVGNLTNDREAEAATKLVSNIIAIIGSLTVGLEADLRKVGAR